MGIYGTLWGPMRPDWNLWEHVGAFGGPWGPRHGNPSLTPFSPEQEEVLKLCHLVCDKVASKV